MRSPICWRFEFAVSSPPLYGYVNGVWSHLQQSCPTEGRGKPEQHRLRQTTTARRFIVCVSPMCVVCLGSRARSSTRGHASSGIGGSRNEQTRNGEGKGRRTPALGTCSHLQALAVRDETTHLHLRVRNPTEGAFEVQWSCPSSPHPARWGSSPKTPQHVAPCAYCQGGLVGALIPRHNYQ